MHKEQLVLEAESWKARCLHEAKVAFEEKRPLDALIWGTKVPILARLARDVARQSFDAGWGIDDAATFLRNVVESIDYTGSIHGLVGR